MNEFDAICKYVESLDNEEYSKTIAEEAVKILPALHAYTYGNIDGVDVLALFLIASLSANGKIDEDDYMMMLPMLRICFGDDFNYDEAKAMVKAFKPRDLKKAVDYLAFIIGELDDELRDDIVALCLLICAVDGKVTAKEKKYIKQLII